MDANGYLVYKGQAGFQLNIIDASQISLVETDASALAAYPNPVASGTELRWTAEPAHVRITSADGRVVADERAPRSLSTSGWAPGIYYITAVGTQSTTTQTLVVY